MPKGKTIRVLIEMPSNWWDFESPMGLASYTMRQMVERAVKDALVEQYLSQVTLPKITINKKKLEAYIIKLLAERALEKGGE